MLEKTAHFTWDFCNQVFKLIHCSHSNITNKNNNLQDCSQTKLFVMLKIVMARPFESCALECVNTGTKK